MPRYSVRLNGRELGQQDAWNADDALSDFTGRLGTVEVLECAECGRDVDADDADGVVCPECADALDDEDEAADERTFSTNLATDELVCDTCGEPFDTWTGAAAHRGCEPRD
jgi:uncharacterized protein YbaR (Trm112 family)